MKIILKEDIENLGRKGDIIKIAAGYGRNYLIPKKLALEVTSSNLKMIEIERQALKKRIEQERLSFQGLIQKLNEVSLTFYRKAGEKDVIFGSVSSSDIKDALDKLGFEIDKKKIILEEPIKRLGNYSVSIRVYHDDRAEIKAEVVREGEEKEEKKKAVEEEPGEEARKGEEEIKKEEEGTEKEEEEAQATSEENSKVESQNSEAEKVTSEEDSKVKTEQSEK